MESQVIESKKKALIVDDDEMLRDGMRTLLEARQFEVVEAENGAVAKNLLQAGAFDLIVSDVQMPVMDGLQLLSWVKLETTSRILLISEISDILQNRHAYQLGADEFINKPFSKDDFLRAVDASLDLNREAVKVDCVDHEYVQVPLTEFVTGSTLRVDLYLKLTANKYIKIGTKGGHLSSERILGYASKGLRWLFMKKQDFALYVGFNIDLARMAHTQTKIEAVRKIRLTKHITGNVISQLGNDGLDRAQLEDVSNVVMNTVELIAANPATMKLMESMEVSGTLPSHSIAVSVWACLIAKRMGWSGQSTFFKITLCGLFHDVGQKEIDEKIGSKPRFELTPTEVKELESHTHRGRDILASIPNMPEDVVLVAAQHHELWSGGGYPYGLRMNQIHPLARLVSVADTFCDLLRDTPASERGLLSLYEIMRRNARDFDREYLEKLGEVVVEAAAALGK